LYFATCLVGFPNGAWCLLLSWQLTFPLRFYYGPANKRNRQMNITLRKASALQNAINETLKGLEVTVTATVDEFQDAAAVIAAKRDEVTKTIVRKTALLDVLYAVRKGVATANAGAGVTELLADVAQLEKRIQLQGQLASATVQLEPAVLDGRLARLREQTGETRIYRSTSGVETSVLTEAEVAAAKAELAELKKLKQALQDRLLELNVGTTVALSDKSVIVLQQEGLL
jgi:hypothetical protein